MKENECKEFSVGKATVATGGGWWMHFVLCRFGSRPSPPSCLVRVFVAMAARGVGLLWFLAAGPCGRLCVGEEDVTRYTMG